MKPLLSIIIPFFGNADKKLLDRCLDSIHSQKVDKNLYEVIIPGDEGQGVYFARNQGIKSAKGDYLFFIDADDYLFADTLQICINTLAEHKPDMLSFQFRKVKGKQKAASVKQPALSFKPAVYGPQYMLHHNFFGAVWRFIIRKEIITENGLYFFLRKHHQDEAFSALAYFYSKKVINIPLIVYAYCRQKNSLTTHGGKEQREERIDDFYYMLINLKVFNTLGYHTHPIQTQALARRIHFLTIDYLIQLIRNKCSVKEFRSQIEKLKEEQLLPLPDKTYSIAYIVTRLFINLLCHENITGRRI